MRDSTRARLRHRDGDAADPRCERGNVDGDEQHGDRRRQAVEPVGVPRLDDRDNGADGGDRPLRAWRRASDRAGERPEADGGPEPEPGEMPVARQQHILDQLGLEHP